MPLMKSFEEINANPIAASAAIARLAMRLPAVQRSGLSVSATLSSVSEAA
jgi:hypothetical protein